MTGKTIWTIGHSTHSIDEFTGILKSYGIINLADVRSLPGSSRYPHFNKEALEVTLPEHGINYYHFKDLGGLRKPIKDSLNTAWRVATFKGYADYMETDEFRAAVKELEKIALVNPTVYMCAEVLWWRCHRSLLSDYLKFNGWEVIHIMGAGKTEEHRYTSPANLSGGKLSYHPKTEI